VGTKRNGAFNPPGTGVIAGLHFRPPFFDGEFTNEPDTDWSLTANRLCHGRPGGRGKGRGHGKGRPRRVENGKVRGAAGDPLQGGHGTSSRQGRSHRRRRGAGPAGGSAGGGRNGFLYCTRPGGDGGKNRTLALLPRAKHMQQLSPLWKPGGANVTGAQGAWCKS